MYIAIPDVIKSFNSLCLFITSRYWAIPYLYNSQMTTFKSIFRMNEKFYATKSMHDCWCRNWFCNKLTKSIHDFTKIIPPPLIDCISKYGKQHEWNERKLSTMLTWKNRESFPKGDKSIRNRPLRGRLNY